MRTRDRIPLNLALRADSGARMEVFHMGNTAENTGLVAVDAILRKVSAIDTLEAYRNGVALALSITGEPRFVDRLENQRNLPASLERFRARFAAKQARERGDA